MHLAEVSYYLLREFSEEKALKITGSLKVKPIEIRESDIVKIASFKKKHSKKNFSYIDCIGYVLALENSLSFVTSDKQFEGMPNVEFVK